MSIKFVAGALFANDNVTLPLMFSPRNILLQMTKAALEY
jgi:hypothetical protein